MSQAYATLIADVLREDTTLVTLASGGVFDRDPRSTGPNVTSTAFETDSAMDILPTIAVVPSTQTLAPGGPNKSFEGFLVARFFVPDYPDAYDILDAMVERTIALIDGYRHSNDMPAYFKWFSRIGMVRGGLFEDVAYDEARFRYVGVR